MTTDTAGHAETDYHTAFEQARGGGRFVVPRCADCGHTFWHPRRHCPRCLSLRITFVEPSWPAHVYSYTLNHRPRKTGGEAPPVMVGYVELADGLRVLADLDLPPGGRVLGAAVRPETRRTGDGLRIVFVPASGDGPS